MKRFLSILAALVLCICMAGTCLAAVNADTSVNRGIKISRPGDNTSYNEDETGYEYTDEIQEVTWEEILGGMDEEDYGGSWVQFEEPGIELFIPDEFLSMEIDEEMEELHFIGFFTPDEETWSPCVSVQYVGPMFGSFEDYKALIESIDEFTVEIMGEVIINGIHCLMYQIPENDLLVIGTEINGNSLEVTFLPFSDYDMQGVYELIAGSLREISGEGDDTSVDATGSDDGSDEDIVIAFDPTQDNLADLLQELLDSLQQGQD